jgi:hypothetical protein
MALAWLVRGDQRRKDARHASIEAAPQVVKPPVPAPRTRNAAELASDGVARAKELASIQARAALQIDAAEHALRQLLADCGHLREEAATPVPAAADQASNQPAGQAQAQASAPLAA